MLTLCSVEAYEDDFLEKIQPVSARQSSAWKPQYKASTAIDGTTACPPEHFSHTDIEKNAWWVAEFEAPIKFKLIYIKNRQDCCKDRLSDYRVTIGNNPNPLLNPACEPKNLRDT